jgi:hypothetical protein
LRNKSSGTNLAEKYVKVSAKKKILLKKGLDLVTGRL